MTIRSYRIQPVTISGQRCDGVWTDGAVAWIGVVQPYTFWSGQHRIVVLPLTTDDHAYIAPPTDWHSLIVEALG